MIFQSFGAKLPYSAYLSKSQKPRSYRVYPPPQTLTLDIFFSSNHNIHKSLRGLLFWASDLLIDRFSKSLSINGTEAQNQRPCELL